MPRISRRLIDVSGMSDIVQRRIPVLTLDSRKSGPTVWLSGCIHGDEPGGAAIIHDVFRAVRQNGLKSGVLHALPLINSLGFENVSRYINAEREDLNRCFPGNAKGSMGERIARRLFDLIVNSEPDLVIDLHNDWIQSVPYVLIEPAALFPTRALRRTTIELAAATGLLTVQDTAPSTEASCTLSGALTSAGVSAFTVEAGGAGAIVESTIDSGKTAMLRVLARLGLTEDPDDRSKQRPHHVLNYTSRPRCASSGIVRFCVNPGDVIAANDRIARVYSAFGSVEETLRAQKPGYVLGVSDHARAVPGAEVIAIAELTSVNERVPGLRPGRTDKRFH